MLLFLHDRRSPSLDSQAPQDFQASRTAGGADLVATAQRNRRSLRRPAPVVHRIVAVD
jgi:hypothetical protein